MSAAPKFLFDECVGKPAMVQLQAIVGAGPTFGHICDIYTSGEQDAAWIPRIAREGGWVVITGDRGRRSKKSQAKLPNLCVEHKVTHVMLSKAVHDLKSATKIGAIAVVWDDIVQTATAPPGSRFVLRMRASKRKATLSVVLEQRDPNREAAKKRSD